MVKPGVDYDWSQFQISLFDQYANTARPKKQFGQRFTKDEILEELRKCSESFAYFCRNYVHIVHPKRGVIKFDLRKYQERIAYQYEVFRFTIMRKPRQMGCSTLAAIWILWKCLFQESFNVIILSIGSRESIEFLKKVYDAFNRLPKWLAGTLKENNKHTMVFDNDSRIQSFPSPKKAARSYACSLLVIDEAAFIDNISDIWTSAFPIVSTGGSVMVLSTVNGTFGAGGWYYHMWSDAEENNNDLYPIQLHYSENPEYSIEWADTTKRNMSEKEWKQEYLCDFIGSVDTYISIERIDQLLDAEKKGTSTVKQPLEKRDQDMTWIWQYPEPGHQYVMGVDVAKRGVGRSNSSFQIIDCNTLEQVCEFQGRHKDIKISTNDYSKICDYYGRMYNNAYMLPERNNMGHAVVSSLYFEYHYPNMHFHKAKLPGWDTNTKTRPQIISALSYYIEPAHIIIRSSRAVRELLTFAEDPDTGKVEKQKGSTDDLLISMGIALCGRLHAIRSRPVAHAGTLGFEYEKNGKTNIEKIAQSEKDKLKEKREQLYKQQSYGKGPYQMDIKLPDGKIEKHDYSWLFDDEEKQKGDQNTK